MLPYRPASCRAHGGVSWRTSTFLPVRWRCAADGTELVETVRGGLDKNGPNVSFWDMTQLSHASRASVCLVAVPEMSAAVVHGLYEVLSFVGEGWGMFTGWPREPRRFQPIIVARSRTPIRNLAGLALVPDHAFEEIGAADIVIVGDLAVARGEGTDGRWSEEVAFLRRQHAAGAVICSVCTGSLMLAEAGLLDGVEATCHWAAADQIRERYPRVLLRPERVLVTAGAEHRLITSGGSASWTDLALYLIARFCSEEEARRIAKLFLFGDRNDGQLPFSARVRPRQHQDAAVAAAQAWIAENYEEPNPVAGMTAASGLSVRTFKRRFEAATGYAPLDYVQSLRVEEAKQMLETSVTPIDDVSAEVGYADAAAFRRMFKRSVGISPLQYRQRFRAVAAE